MFSRNSGSEPKTINPLSAAAVAGPPALNGSTGAPTRPMPSSNSDARPISVIGNDLKIIGQGLRIITEGTLQVDGTVEGDVRGAEVIIGEKGRVTGTVAAERVVVRGEIAGVIRGNSVTLQSSARVEGDIHHKALSIEEGASFDGRCRRPPQGADVELDAADATEVPQPQRTH